MNPATVLPAIKPRSAGVLLHLTSLPHATGRGVLGEPARRWIDLMAQAGFRVWQTLPVNPPAEDGSPYFSRSVHAGSTELIDLEDLERRGWLSPEVNVHADESPWHARKRRLLETLIGFENRASPAERADFGAFLEAHRSWLVDDALFVALKSEHQGLPWTQWRTQLKQRDVRALADARERHHAAIEQFVFEQYLFDLQWRALREHARERGVRLFGDIPIYVAHDSVEVWTHRENFLLDDQGAPRAVAGVPPDYFSADGQLWGNPLYDWPRMRAEGFSWWLARLRTQLERFDLLRIDHFRGLESYWAVPAGAATAREGSWQKAEGAALLGKFIDVFGQLPIVAEDLGVITPEVEALRDEFGLPGMRILQFAFGGGADNPYLPHNHVPNTIAYTGTHDNDTTVGWYRSLDPGTRAHVSEYFELPDPPIPYRMIRAALASVAALAILPMQDLLALGSEARMNTPGTLGGNWSWRFAWEQVPSDFAARWSAALRRYAR
jgi:4-alpha-glucanotransferase